MEENKVEENKMEENKVEENKVEENLKKDTITIITPPKDGEIETPRIFIALLCYGGMVYTNFMIPLLNLQGYFSKMGIYSEIFTISNESLITRGRNNCVAQFLYKEENFTHLLFIDVDIGFHPMNVIDMLNFNKDVVCGSYAKKGINWKRIFDLRYSIENPEEMKQISFDFAVNFLQTFNHENKLVIEFIENRWARVSQGGTGFMLIKKKVFNILQRTFPERILKQTQDKFTFDKPVLYNFFNSEKDTLTGIFLSEDYLFCELCKRCGIDIWMDTRSKLIHNGTFSFEGSLGDMIKYQEENPESITKNFIFKIRSLFKNNDEKAIKFLNKSIENYDKIINNKKNIINLDE